MDRLKASGNMSVYDSVRELGKVTPLVYAADNGNAELVVLPAYPDELLNIGDSSTGNPTGHLPATITYQIIRREPGTIGNHPFDPGKVIKPTYREVLPREDEYIQLWGQWFDNLIQLDCWSTSNGEADQLVEWLEGFLVQYAFYFKEKGLQEMYYFRGGRFTWGTTEEEAMTRWRNPFKVRSMTYYVRTEKLWWKDLYKIKEIITRLEVD